MDILLDGRPEGVEAAAKIRSDYDVPVIFLTGKDDEQTLAQAASAEPMAYLLKPFTPAAIRAAIEVALRQDRAQRDRQEAARKELRDQCRASLAETISSVLSGQAAGRPGTAGGPKIQAGSTARREARIKSDSLRGFELQSYSPDRATLGLPATSKPCKAPATDPSASRAVSRSSSIGSRKNNRTAHLRCRAPLRACSLLA